MSTVLTQSLSDMLIEMNAFNKTGVTPSTHKMEPDFLFNIDDTFTSAEAGSDFNILIGYNIVVATKWRLYGTIP